MARDDAQLRSEGGPAGLPEPVSKLAVLLVDDDPDCRLLLKDAIADGDVATEVHEVSSGLEAMDFLNRRGRYASAPRPSLIFMDVEMPGPSGLQTLKMIKSDPALADIPVVMMTGVSGDEEMREAATSGANSYTLKPARAEAFLQTVLASTHYWLRVHQYPGHHLPAEACRR